MELVVLIVVTVKEGQHDGGTSLSVFVRGQLILCQINNREWTT